MAAELVAQDTSIWLSRSWTTRPPRPGERERGAYEFVDKETFEDAISRLPFPDPRLNLHEAIQLASGRSAAHHKLRGEIRKITGR